MAAQGSYPIGSRTLAGTDTLTGVVTGNTADVPLATLVSYVVSGLSGTFQPIGSYATAGANSNITSINGLTTALSVAQGGTGATSAINARANLGLVIGVNVQAYLGFTPANDSAVVHNTGAESIAGLKTFAVQPNITTAQSCVHLDGQNGWGSTNTYIRRFTNVRINQGTDITYADSATLGASFTINTTGVYAISWDDNFGGQMWAGITVNDTYPTVGILTMQGSAPSQIIAEGLAISNGSSNAVTVHRTVYLTAGSIIRAHTDGNSGGALTNATHFTITRVS